MTQASHPGISALAMLLVECAVGGAGLTCKQCSAKSAQ